LLGFGGDDIAAHALSVVARQSREGASARGNCTAKTTRRRRGLRSSALPSTRAL